MLQFCCFPEAQTLKHNLKFCCLQRNHYIYSQFTVFFYKNLIEKLNETFIELFKPSRRVHFSEFILAFESSPKNRFFCFGAFVENTMSQEHEADELGDMEEEELTIHTEFEDEEELITQFNELMTDPENLETAANYLYESLLDEAILGSVFEVHNLIKTGLLKALEGEPEDPTQFLLVNAPDVDVFGSSKSAKINMDCTCPKCEKLVATARFAPHLEKCMGSLFVEVEINNFNIPISKYLLQVWDEIHLGLLVIGLLHAKEVTILVQHKVMTKTMQIGPERNERKKFSKFERMGRRKMENHHESSRPEIGKYKKIP